MKKCQSWPATGGEQAAVLPPIEIDKNRLASTPWKGLHTWDIQSPSQRRLAWAYLALLQPRWVHLAPPCTFWSPLARRCNRRTEADNERRRVQALVFLVFSLQVCNLQRQRHRFWSLEHPPHCVSWNLDIVKDFTERELATGGNALEFDSCAWGARGPRQRQALPQAAAFLQQCTVDWVRSKMYLPPARAPVCGGDGGVWQPKGRATEYCRR